MLNAIVSIPLAYLTAALLTLDQDATTRRASRVCAKKTPTVALYRGTLPASNVLRVALGLTMCASIRGVKTNVSALVVVMERARLVKPVRPVLRTVGLVWVNVVKTTATLGVMIWIVVVVFAPTMLTAATLRGMPPV